MSYANRHGQQVDPESGLPIQSDVEALVNVLGEAINVLVTGRPIVMDERVRLIGALLDIGELAGLRGAPGA